MSKFVKKLRKFILKPSSISKDSEKNLKETFKSIDLSPKHLRSSPKNIKQPKKRKTKFFSFTPPSILRRKSHGVSNEPQPFQITPLQSKYLRLRNRERSDSMGSVKQLKYECFGLDGLGVKVFDEVKIEKIENNKFVNGYRYIKLLGQGGQGKVRLVEKNNNQFAMKIIRKDSLKTSCRGLKVQKSGVAQIRKELLFYRRINHVGCIRLFEFIDDIRSNKIYLIFEYASKGELFFINEEDGTIDRESLSEERSRKYFFELINAIDYLHTTAKIAHCDIKPSNILLNEDDMVKLTDFGVACDISENDMLINRDGTFHFFSPEATDEHIKYISAKKCDIYATGVTLYCMVFGKLPFFYNNSSHEGATKSIHKLFEIIQNKECSLEGKDISDSLKDLIKRLLEKDPMKRITISEIRKHKWMKIYQKNNQFLMPPLDLPFKKNGIKVNNNLVIGKGKFQKKSNYLDLIRDDKKGVSFSGLKFLNNVNSGKVKERLSFLVFDSKTKLSRKIERRKSI